MDKGVFASDSMIRLRDPASGFPVGQSLGILKWRYTTKEESKAPLNSTILYLI